MTHLAEKLKQDPLFGTLRSAGLLETIMSYELPFTSEYVVKKLGWEDSVARKSLKEYKRFLFLAYTAGEEITPSTMVDEVWHLHILHTKDYDRFSEVCGRKLHHNPGMPGGSEVGRWQDQYENTLKRYEREFGEIPPTLLWPSPLAHEEINLRGFLEEMLTMLPT